MSLLRPSAAALVSALLLLPAGAATAPAFTWRELPPLPDPLGFAGPYAGIAGGSLLVAGGANFPGGRPWTGAKKAWHGSVFVLDTPAGVWRLAGRLPQPLGYGVSLTIPSGVLCMGGSNEREHVRDVFLMRREGGDVRFDAFPALPRPLANAAGARVGDMVYVTGGIERPDGVPGRQLWALSLVAGPAARAWRELAPCPGRPRMLATAGATDRDFFVFGGVDLVPDGKGGLRREYLRGAWRYRPGEGWKQLADMPEPRAAAPGPAPFDGVSHLIIFGGDNGELADQVSVLRDAHPGFARGILAYHIITDTWAPAGIMPRAAAEAVDPATGVWPAVTTAVVSWHGKYVLPSGEVRPGVRTPRVIAGEPGR